MKELTCKNCGDPREVGRRLCKKCNSLRINSYPRYTWTKNCDACKNEYEAWRKEQSLCSSCNDLRSELKSETISTNQYVYTKAPGMTEHRAIAIGVLGRKLASNEVIHHIDDNPKNNELDNLMLMTRTSHGKLHQYLDLQRVVIEKSMNENQENCWNNLIAPMTTAWLETTSAKVQKLSEIGQSAAEPLNSIME